MNATRSELFDEHGPKVYWFIERLTPEAEPSLRRAILAVSFEFSETLDNTRPLLHIVLRRVYQMVQSSRIHQGAHTTSRWKIDRMTNILQVVGDASRRPTRADGDYLRLRLPIAHSAAIHLHCLGLDDAAIAFILDLPAQLEEFTVGRLSEIIRRGLSHLVQRPRMALAVLELITRGGGDPIEAVAVVAAHWRGRSHNGATPAREVLEQIDQLARLLERERPAFRVDAHPQRRLVMIIYNERDLAAVRRLRDDLHKVDLQAWIFDDDAPAAGTIYAILEDILTRAGAFTVAIGPTGRGLWQQMEIGAVLSPGSGLPVVVVLLETLAPDMKPDTGHLLGALRRYDLRQPPREARIAEIRRAIAAPLPEADP